MHRSWKEWAQGSPERVAFPEIVVADRAVLLARLAHRRRVQERHCAARCRLELARLPCGSSSYLVFFLVKIAASDAAHGVHLPVHACSEKGASSDLPIGRVERG